MTVSLTAPTQQLLSRHGRADGAPVLHKPQHSLTLPRLQLCGLGRPHGSQPGRGQNIEVPGKESPPVLEGIFTPPPPAPVLALSSAQLPTA
ncbi:unnamed protein product [Arctogadus glacialis]